MSNSKSIGEPRPSYGLWVIAVLLVMEAIGSSVYIPQYSVLFEGFGAEVPLLTQAVLMGAWGFWLLPIIAFIAIVFVPNTRNLKTYFAVFLLFIGMLWVPVAIYGLYIPVFEMSEVAQS